VDEAREVGDASVSFS